MVGDLTEIPSNTEIKVKALTSIAAEHAIRWDSKLFEEYFKQQNENLKVIIDNNFLSMDFFINLCMSVVNYLISHLFAGWNCYFW